MTGRVLVSWPVLVAWLVLTVGTVLPAGAQLREGGPSDRPSLAVVEQSTGAAQASSDEEELPSVASLFLDLGGDVRRLPSLETVLTLGAGGSLSLAVHPRDDEIVRYMSEEFGSGSFFGAGKVAGDLRTQLGAGLAVFVGGRLASNHRFSTLGADLVRAQILNAGVTHGTKALVQRQRPNGGKHSFPSGHASAAFATAAVLQRRLGWRAGVPAYGLAVYTSASRVADNKHFVSDVIFGAAVGVVMGRTVTVGRGRSKVALSPVLLTGGAGIAIARVPALD